MSFWTGGPGPGRTRKEGLGEWSGRAGPSGAGPGLGREGAALLRVPYTPLAPRPAPTPRRPPPSPRCRLHGAQTLASAGVAHSPSTLGAGFEALSSLALRCRAREGRPLAALSSAGAAHITPDAKAPLGALAAGFTARALSPRDASLAAPSRAQISMKLRTILTISRRICIRVPNRWKTRSTSSAHLFTPCLTMLVETDAGHCLLK